MKRFILLLNHDDISLSAYLQNLLESGKQFVGNSGNVFTFQKSEPSDERIRAVTCVNEDPDLRMRFQLENYCALMKKRGWKVLHVGGPEDIFDSKRHVFLQTDREDIPDPLVDTEQIKKAKKREKKSLIRCAVMLLILLGFGIFFFGHDTDLFLSSNHILIPGLVSIVCWVLAVVYSLHGAVVIKRRTQCANGFRNFLVVDKAVLFCMMALAALLAALIFDLYLYPDTGRTVIRGEQNVKIYQDSLPLSMTDLEIPMNGAFHSSRLTERNGVLMKSLYAAEQSFSDPNGTENLSLLSYSLYRSNSSAVLDWVTSVKGMKKLPVSEELAERWHSTEVHTDGIHRLSARYGDALLVLSTSADIVDVAPETVLDKLEIDYGTNLLRETDLEPEL